jgi:hypothetical protein
MISQKTILNSELDRKTGLVFDSLIVWYFEKHSLTQRDCIQQVKQLIVTNGQSELGTCSGPIHGKRQV